MAHIRCWFFYAKNVRSNGKISQAVCRVIVKKYGVQMQHMSQQNSSSAYSEEHSHEGLQMIDILKAPIVQMGHGLGYEVIENHDLGAGPVHVAWIFKPGSESMPDRSILQLRKYVTVLTPSTLVSKSGVQGSRERRSSQTGEVV
jgi:hypothetical protein